MEQCAENSSADTRPVVMMVDDDDMTRMMGLEYLNQAGFEAVEAEDGQTALDTIQQLRPDIILMDVEMPNLDGYAACAEIRKLEGFANIPILMLTGLDIAMQFAAAGIFVEILSSNVSRLIVSQQWRTVNTPAGSTSTLMCDCTAVQGLMRRGTTSEPVRIITYGKLS